MFHKVIYNLGTAKRNPSLEGYFSFLKESDRWSKEALLEYQLEKCKSFLTFVNEHSPYYQSIFQEIGFRPETIESIEDLKQIPPIDKPTLLGNTDQIHTVYPFKKRIYSETSGTSGQPLKFYKDEEWDSHNRATMFRGYSWYGVNPWDKNGYFWGYNIDKSGVLKTKVLDFLQNRFRLFSYDKDEITRFTKKLDSAVYLHGYSSMIYEVAKIVNQMGRGGKYNLKMIKGTSEKIYDSYQDVVKKAFGHKIISEYGAAESGLIAFECPEGNMHINVENVIVEVENGEIVVTNLLSRSFPIIRYKLGDVVTLAAPEFECNCGRKHPVIVDVLGRVGKKIIGNNRQYPSLTFYYVFKNLALEKNLILNYQAVQEERGKVTLKIEQEESGFKDDLKEELKKYFSDDVLFNILYQQTLHTMDGKLRDFITTIDN